MSEVVTIIGAGPTAISFLYNYLQLIDEGDILPRTIYLIEKRRAFGPGCAYEFDLSSNIMNTKAGFITPFYDQPGHFFRWLKSEKKTWRVQYPDLQVNEDSYVPRALFGLYLQRQMTWLAESAKKRRVDIIQIHAECKDIQYSETSYIVKTDCNVTIRADFIFFFCGTLSAKSLPAVSGSSLVFASPYPIQTLQQRIPVDAAVGIVGARLSCIDAVVGLVEQGHQGTITIHSRTGYFPSVRGTQGRITPKALTAEQVDALVRLKGSLRLQDLVDLAQMEIAIVEGEEECVDFQLPSPPQDLATFLRDEISKAAAPRSWQAVLYCTNSIIDRLWSLLHEEDKIEFLDKYFSMFMAYRVSIPMENARKILRYLESGQLRFCAGDFHVDLDASSRPRVTLNGQNDESFCYDFLINAIGSPRAVRNLDSDLISKLLERGVMTANDLGGVAVDASSYQLIGADGTLHPRLYAVGELTTGAFFFTSALDINARHARLCAVSFAKSFSRRIAETDDAERSFALPQPSSSVTKLME